MTGQSAFPIYGVILAGGLGTRFWPLSRSQYPKQVLRLMGSESMIQSTIERLLPRIPLERLAVVTNASQAEVIRLHLHRKGWEKIRSLAGARGPEHRRGGGPGRGTPGSRGRGLSTGGFPRRPLHPGPGGPAGALDIGASLGSEGLPGDLRDSSHPPGDRLWLHQTGSPLDEQGSAYRSLRFMEKPDLARAQAFLQEGGYYWNSGIFMFRREVLLEAFSRYLPELHQGLARLLDGGKPAALG